MKGNRFATSLAVLAVLLCAPAIAGAKRNLADYTLRLHIYGTSWSHNSTGYHGLGRGNLFDDQGTPHGVEFTYDCQDHLMGTSGTEAYPAMWKKPGLSLEIIFGEIGQKPDQFHSCEFKVAEKSFVFYHHNGEMSTESAQEFLANHKSQTPVVGPPGPADVPVSANPHPY